MAKEKPGDLSRLGRTDPLFRALSQYPYFRQTRGKVTQGEVDAADNDLNESARREFRQSEDAGSGGWMKNATHTIVDGSENK